MRAVSAAASGLRCKSIIDAIKALWERRVAAVGML